MGSFVLGFKDVDKTKVSVVGGKGANLGELTTIDGIQVPDGFCISTEAFRRIISDTPSISGLLDQLSLLRVEDRDKIGQLGKEIRRIIQGIAIPHDISEQINQYLSTFGEENAWAVRSSATAEDLPTTSFAGQQDTYLNIIGKEAVLTHILKCCASLFTERAIIYRAQNGFDHRKVYLSVVIQKMVFPEVSGILFTADPITGNRKVSSIDASFGLGEALVSGIVNADVYKVRNDEIIDKKISTKKVAIYALDNGGTKQQEINLEQQTSQALTDNQILQLERLGRKIEEHFGCPQDIEWCLVKNAFFILQSRPITTLYPVPEVRDQENHVYISVGHQQMMTDALKPLGLSVFQLTAARPMYSAGGRLFVDITNELASPGSRGMVMSVVGKSDPLVKDALTTITERGDFITLLSDDKNERSLFKGNKGSPHPNVQTQIEYDPTIVPELIRRSQTSIADLKRNIKSKSGLDLINFIREDIHQLTKIVSDPQTLSVVMTGMNALFWVNEKMNEWLGEKNAADTLSQSVPNNITSEMGLALLDVADVIRPYPQIIEYLQRAKDDRFFEDLIRFHGGHETRDAITGYLEKYGMRCAGEIDITKTRWSERPTILVPMILSHIKNFEPNAGISRFEQGRQEALRKERDLVDRLKQLPDGEQKAEEAKRMISLIRNFSGYREYPKYSMISRYWVYKQALLKEAEQLVRAKIIYEREDIYYLRFEELHEVVRTNILDYQVINQRKDEYKFFEKLNPPRVITSEGEIITGKYNRENIPAGAIAGLAVSSGVIEGRARVILNMEDADIEEGDILVTSFTDPSWTPLFVSIKGLVTEVGGLMTHGAVIAREYGLPAVVGVENATELIKDGQRIRVNGTEGYLQIL